MEPLTAQQAYQDAPELRAEMLYLLANAARLIETTPTADEEREHLLRRAAVVDRYVEETAGGFALDEELECEQLAELLLDFDRRHDTGRGAIPATDPHWDGRVQDPDQPRRGLVAYLRQEYKQWLEDQTIEEEDQQRRRSQAELCLEDHSTAPCPTCGHDLEYGAAYCPKCGTYYKYGHVFEEDGQSVLYARDTEGDTVDDSGKTFDVTIWTSDQDRIVVENLDDETAREYEDLPFTAPHVKIVEVQQTTDEQE